MGGKSPLPLRGTPCAVIAAPAQAFALNDAQIAQYIAPQLAQLPAGTTASNDVGYVRMIGTGGRKDGYETKTQHFVTGADVTLGNWESTFSFTHSQSHIYDIAEGGYASANAINSLIDSGAYDPFSGDAQADVLAPAVLPRAAAMDMRIDGQAVILSGQVVRADCTSLADLLAKSGVNQVVLTNSGGGDAYSRYCMGSLIRRRGLATTIRGRCGSACSLIWLGGVERRRAWSGAAARLTAPARAQRPARRARKPQHWQAHPGNARRGRAVGGGVSGVLRGARRQHRR